MFNIKTCANEISAMVYDSCNQLLASVYRTSPIYLHYAIDDQDGNRRYDLAESSKPSAKEWTIVAEETEIGGFQQILHEPSQELMGNRGADLDDLKLNGAFLLTLEGIVEENDLFAILGGVYVLMTE